MKVLVNGRATLEVVMSEGHVRSVEVASMPARQALGDFETASVNEGHMGLHSDTLRARLRLQKSNSPKLIASILARASPPAFLWVPPVPPPPARPRQQ